MIRLLIIDDHPVVDADGQRVFAGSEQIAQVVLVRDRQTVLPPSRKRPA